MERHTAPRRFRESIKTLSARELYERFCRSRPVDPKPETTPLEPAVWQMMSALASDAYELRMVAPAEFELVEPDRTAPSSECLVNGVESEKSAV